jgi:hypothetical protein
MKFSVSQIRVVRSEHMSLLNPMNINGPNAAAPYQQPNTNNPAPNPQVASHPTGANNLSYPLPEIENARTPLDNPSAGGMFPPGVAPHLVS